MENQLEKIKSKYILRWIFSFLRKKVKLKLIVYNNSLKEKLSLNITDSIKNSNNYIIKDDNGNYKINSLINNFTNYQGGFSNGEKNGFGKEYELIEIKMANLNQSKIMKKLKINNFKSIKKNTYFNFIPFPNASEKGIINKNGIEYFYYINLQYEGEFKSGDRNGKGKEYDIYGNLIYEGEYLNGEKNGKGKEYDDNGNITYEGEFSHGFLKEGVEKDYDENGNLLFEGEISILNEEAYKIKGKEYDGKGNVIFDGELINYQRWKGKGKEYNKTGDLIYDGEYLNGKRWNGKGKEYDDFGKIIFDGEYLNGKRWNGELEEITFKNLPFNNGEGKIKFEQFIFIGKYINGSKIGKEFDSEGNLLYEGNYFDEKRFNGKGKEYYNNRNLKFEGKYLLGQKIGKEYDNNGNIIFEGKYLDEKRWKGIIIDSNNGIEFDNGNYKGKEYDIYGNIIFEGEFSSGKKLKGKRKIYDQNNNLLFNVDYNDNSINEKQDILLEIYSTYEGQNGLKIDFGKEVEFKNNSIFEGEFINGKKNNGMIRKYNDLKIEDNEGIGHSNFEENKKRNFNLLIFESEFQNGEINGKGKEYDKYGQLIYEGEYKDGKRHGKGKELDYNHIKFKGEYKNGKRWKGKEYNVLCDLIFDGEYKNGKKWKGKEYWKKNIVFIGEYKNGKRWNGKGKEDFFYTASIFEDDYINKKNNYEKETGSFHINYTTFEGDYINGIRKGKEHDLKGHLLFEGEFQYDKKDRKGIAFDKNSKKKIFEGEYINNKMWNGIEYSYHGIYQFEQIYKEGIKNEKIIMKEIYKCKLRFEGESLNGIKNGKGKEYFKNKLIFEGEYLNGKRNGFGIEYNFDGGKFVGEFKNGKKWNGTGYLKNDEIDYNIINGYGEVKEYYDGKLIYEGKCLDGKRHGKGKEYDFLTGKLKYKGIFIYGEKYEK